MKKHLTFAFSVGLLLSGCVFDSDSKSPSAAAGAKIFALGTSYSNGGMAALDRVSGDMSLSTKLLTLATSDAILDRDSADGVLYLINRSASVVTGYESSSDLSQAIFDVNLGSGSDPYAVAALSGKLWVACYGSAYLKAVDLSTQKIVDSIDLSAYADTLHQNRNPFALAVHAWNGKLAVVLGRLGGDWTPNDSSLVVILDPGAKKEVKRIALPWKNAYGVAWSGDKVLVACVGAWAKPDNSSIVLDGGLALVDLAQGTSKALVSESTAGGNISLASFGPSGTAFVGVADASYSGSVRAVDLSTGALGSKVSNEANVGSFAWDGSHLWMGTSSSTLLRASSSGEVLNTFPCTLSPTSLAILPE